MTESNNVIETTAGRFRGDINRNEVALELDRFLEILNENNKLKDQIRDLETSGKKNPWQKIIHFAKMVDSWRPWPRAFMGVYILLLYESTMWFMALEEPNGPQSALISTIVGAGAAWFGLYVNSGPKDLD